MRNTVVAIAFAALLLFGATERSVLAGDALGIVYCGEWRIYFGHDPQKEQRWVEVHENVHYDQWTLVYRQTIDEAQGRIFVGVRTNPRERIMFTEVPRGTAAAHNENVFEELMGAKGVEDCKRRTPIFDVLHSLFIREQVTSAPP